jgi:hypothetical protein
VARILNLSTSQKGTDELHAVHRKDKDYAQELARRKWASSTNIVVSINEMADLVCTMLDGEGLHYTFLTVRDWIAKVAPPELRKPGRPPKK